jgi:hypothetical protein
MIIQLGTEVVHTIDGIQDCTDYQWRPVRLRLGQRAGRRIATNGVAKKLPIVAGDESVTRSRQHHDKQLHDKLVVTNTLRQLCRDKCDTTNVSSPSHVSFITSTDMRYGIHSLSRKDHTFVFDAFHGALLLQVVATISANGAKRGDINNSRI